jgi:serine phosphatase RsbU (regulator of sigma subunit)
LGIQQEIGDAEGQGRSFTNIGILYSDQGLNDKALKYFLKAEDCFIRCHFTLGLYKLYNSIGVMFFYTKDYPNSEKYFEEALKISGSIIDDVSKYTTYANYANTLSENQKHTRAIALYRLAYEIAKRKNNYSDWATISNNLSSEFMVLNLQEEAAKYTSESFKLINTHQLDRYLKIIPFSVSARIYEKKGEYKKAASCLDSALAIAIQYEQTAKHKELLKDLGHLLLKDGQTGKAALILDRALDLSDSLYKKNLEEKLQEATARHNVEKKEKEIELLNHARKNQKRITLLLIIIISLSLIALLVAIWSYLNKRRDNRVIQSQKTEVELKNKIIEDKQSDIVSSINYAHRLQKAILPAKSFWKTHLPDSFILYLPKDIVAGDFYWMETVKHDNDTLILFAVADCTGHGVPGALVSVVCSNALNRCVHQFNLTEPGKILDKARELVIATFDKSGENVMDGMDISLCALSINTLQLQWAGANNPLWLIKDGQLLETKANKQPIGRHPNPVPFTTHSFKLHRSDSIYLFSDGFADQFGGPLGKKYKYKQLAEDFLTIHHLNIEQQHDELQSRLKAWKGPLEQVDDVCVIGIKI